MSMNPATPPGEKTHDISGAGAGQPPKKILLLEDDPDLMDTLAKFLESCSFQVVTVANGAEGLRKIVESDFDVILCDLVMPNLPGDMFYLAVERSKPHLCKRFIFMTGHRADPKWDEFIRKIGALAIWKPFQPHELLDRIEVIEARAHTAHIPKPAPASKPALPHPPSKHPPEGPLNLDTIIT